MQSGDFRETMLAGVGLSVVIRQDTESWRLHPLIREFAEAKNPHAAREARQRLSSWFVKRLPESAGTAAWEEIDEARWRTRGTRRYQPSLFRSPTNEAGSRVSIKSRGSTRAIYTTFSLDEGL
jgi:hypothetical protein